MVKFLAIDSGTHYTGWALFDGRKLLEWGYLEAPHKEWTHERIGIILEQIRELLLEHDPQVVVCEGSYSKWTPEIALLIKTLKKLTSLYNKEWLTYTSSTVVRCMSPTGKSPKLRSKRKEIIAKGVHRKYPKTKLVTQQDTLDAIAIGHTHLERISNV